MKKVLLALLLVPIGISFARVTSPQSPPAAESNPPAKPSGADRYDPTSKQWLCAINKDPLTGNADGYYPCPDGTTETERKAVAEFDACVKRSGKEPQTMGWSWAASKCRESINSF